MNGENMSISICELSQNENSRYENLCRTVASLCYITINLVTQEEYQSKGDNLVEDRTRCDIVTSLSTTSYCKGLVQLLPEV
jgi:hypothetical protein